MILRCREQITYSYYDWGKRKKMQIIKNETGNIITDSTLQEHNLNDNFELLYDNNLKLDEIKYCFKDI